MWFDGRMSNIPLDEFRVARDYALLRLEYIKGTAGLALNKKIENITEQFEIAQDKLTHYIVDRAALNAERSCTKFFNYLAADLPKEMDKRKKLGHSVPQSPPLVPNKINDLWVDAQRTPPPRKKNTKLAAKPLLENIDENSPASKPIRGRRKSLLPDESAEEKVSTPARRSTRIRSNTSITFDTPQGFESPRAKRAARRNSLAGSDNESAVTTPVKSTRRVRRDSTASVDNTGDAAPLVQSTNPVTDEVIPEEPELQNNSSGLSNDENLTPNNTSIRKSTRISTKMRKSMSESQLANKSLPLQQNKKTNKKSDTLKSGNNDKKKENEKFLSSSKHYDQNGMNSEAQDNNAISAAYNSKRNLFTSNDDNSSETFESTAKYATNNQNEAILEDTHKSTEKLNNEILSIENISFEGKQSLAKSVDDTDAGSKHHAKPLADFFEENEDAPVKCTVLIEDSSSNPGSDGKKPDADDDHDQCVPVLDQQENEIASEILENNSFSTGLNIFKEKPRSVSASTINTCEPMDIDETIPDNVSAIYCNDPDDESPDTKPNKSADKISPSENDKSKNIIDTQTKLNEKSYATSIDNYTPVDKTNDTSQSLCLEKSSENIETELSVSKTSSMEDPAYTSGIPSMKSKNVKNQRNSISNIDKSDAKIIINTSDTDPIQLKQTLEHNKSKNNSLSQSNTSQDLEKSGGNANKSTLILSQIKDDETSMAKTPKSLIKNTSQTEAVELNVAQTPKIKSISRSKSSENTPLKDKTSKNLGMQTSTPVVSDNLATNKRINEMAKISLKSSNKVKSQESDDSNVDSDTADKSSDFKDDEAEDTGDDYESGDSRDDEERQYDEDNEIVEQGETLTSDEEMSNDSDYEKGSFVVSSNEEDNDLLDGSRDDLNMSDNELTMSAKSKKKFNERKAKDQKKASREMYEARHNSLYESSSSDDQQEKPKKLHNRLRLDSSALGSEDDVVRPITNKMRINSTLDDGRMNASQNASKSLKKDDSSMNITSNENEITAVCDKSILNKKDPLQVDIKPEPKTPQKVFDLSTVNISTRWPVNEVHVNENVSLIASNETSDPLQVNDDSNDSLSENETVKKNIKDKNAKAKISQNKSDDESSSDSIDFKLLFPDSESDSAPEAPKDSTTTPLTNVKNITNISDDGSSNLSFSVSKKNRKSESMLNQSNLLLEGEKQVNRSAADVSICDISSKKKHKKKASEEKSVSDKKQTNTSFDNSNADNREDMEESKITAASTKKTNKKGSLSKLDVSETTEKKSSGYETVNDSSITKKKKKKVSQSFNASTIEFEEGSNSKRKIKLKGSGSLNNSSVELPETLIVEEEHTVVAEAESNDISISKKKKKKHSLSLDTAGEVSSRMFSDTGLGTSQDEFDHLTTEEIDSNNTSFNKKKKKKLSVSLHSELDTSLEKGKRKKMPKTDSRDKQEVSESLEEIESNNMNLSKSKTQQSLFLNSENKHKSINLSEADSQETDVKSSGEEFKQKDNSLKNKKKKLSDSQIFETELEIAPAALDGAKVPSEPTSTVQDCVAKMSAKSKKRKRRSSCENYMESTVKGITETLGEPLLESGGQAKKLKLVHTDENTAPEDLKNLSDSSMNKKKNKLKSSESEEISNEESAKSNKKNKKRKVRDDDEDQSNAKVFKQSLQNTVHVPRLPSKVLQKLEDKSLSNRNIPRIVSTTNFIVEPGKIRKNKPSQYLEDSVYLESDSPEKPKTGKITKPKVLPFIPTASTSSFGFTSNFKVNVIPSETKFIAQASDISNFKNDKLSGKKIKKMGTYELYRKQRTLKLSKF